MIEATISLNEWLDSSTITEVKIDDDDKTHQELEALAFEVASYW